MRKRRDALGNNGGTEEEASESTSEVEEEEESGELSEVRSESGSESDTPPPPVPPHQRRKKVRNIKKPTEEQSRNISMFGPTMYDELVAQFELDPHPDMATRQQLAHRVGASLPQISKW